MTKAQIRKLETVLARLEALQNEIDDRRIREELGKGKRCLLEALTRAERE